jgi:tetratricopeptide (TPR) repeat protein
MAKRKRSPQRRTGATPQAAAAPPRPRRPQAPQQRKPARQPLPAGVTAAPLPFDRDSLLAAAAVGLIAFVVYALTVEPSVPPGDSGELIAAAYVLGVAHPPGYPLLMMLGRLAMLLPGGEPALRMNLLSALCDAVTVGIVFLIVCRLVAERREDGVPRRDPVPFVAGAVGALLLAFSTLFWAYSVVTEVFALNNLFAAALLLVALEWRRRPGEIRLVWLFMLLLGLSLTNQQTIVLLVPAFLVLAWAGGSALGRSGWRPRPSELGIAAGSFLVGLLPYAYLPLAAGANPALNWGDPSTWSRFQTDVLRKNYGTTSLVVGGKQGSVGENMQLLFGDLTRGFVIAGIVLAVLGLWWGWRQRPWEGVALLVAFLVAGPLFMLYTNTSYPDNLTKGVIARFYILPSIPLAIAAGLGAFWVLRQAARLGAAGPRPALVTGLVGAILLCAPAASLAAHYGENDQSGNRVALDYAEDLLGPLAPNALLLMRSDENYTSVAYAQNVAHFRPDVIALDTELLKLPTYVAQVRREHPTLLIPFTAYDGGTHTSLNTFVADNLAQRPVYFVGPQVEKKFGKPFDQLYDGLATELVAKGSAPDPTALMVKDEARFAALRYPTRTYPSDTWEATIASDYGYAAFDLGYSLDTGGSNYAQAEKWYRTAIRLGPSIAAAYKNLGLLLHDHGGDPKEVIALWQRFLQLDPTDPQAPAIRTVLGQLQGK